MNTIVPPLLNVQAFRGNFPEAETGAVPSCVYVWGDN